MWTKKYWRVQTKLAAKKLKKSPQIAIYSAMGVAFLAVCGLFTYEYHFFKTHTKVSTLTQWQYIQKTVNQRMPASSESFSCNHNGTQIDHLRKEVQKLERKYQTGSVIEGTVFGLDLTRLPSIGAQLLADHKSLIGDQSKTYDFSGCKDVPCVFNKIYQDESELSGYYIYYWYLKTGSIISSTNFIPNQESHLVGHYNNRVFNFEDYLFSKQKLKNFYFLAKSLPEKLTYIPLFKSIHKIPAGSRIEGERNCSSALPNGQILVTDQCINTDDMNFYVNITKEIAKYADRQEGLKRKVTRLSGEAQWLDQSLWTKESYFDFSSHRFTYRWQTQLPQENFLDRKSLSSPTEQLASLIANYRFNPTKFNARTPRDIANYIKSDFYHNKAFDSNGLYYLYLNKSLNEWAKQENKVWSDCIENHLEEKDLQKSNRNLASTLEHPLYQCVENKIPGFIDHTVKKIQKDSFEGCKFFGDLEKYGHVSERYFTALNKFLIEKVLQRKIEIQKHGEEVLIGQQIKQKFIESVDPKSIYIKCYGDINTRYCYENKMSKLLGHIITTSTSMSDYYKDIVREDILNLYPYDEIKLKSREAVKMFLAPYTTRLTQAATKLWDTCKVQGMDHDVKIDLPMTFSGGRYYINAKLINCINDKIDKEIYDLAQLTAFHKNSDGRVEFKLNREEKDFALSFLKGNLLQTLNNILDKEYQSEKVMFNDYFRRAKVGALNEFSSRDDFIKGIYAASQVENMCLKEIKKFYPENYFYHTKQDVDKRFGRSICSIYIKMPNVSEKINKEITSQWQVHRDEIVKYLERNYTNLVEDCRSDYPEIEGYGKAKNAQLRNTCIQLSYTQAISESLKDWRGHKHYKYFYNKQEALQRYLDSKRRTFVSEALNPKI